MICLGKGKNVIKRDGARLRFCAIPSLQSTQKTEGGKREGQVACFFIDNHLFFFASYKLACP